MGLIVRLSENPSTGTVALLEQRAIGMIARLSENSSVGTVVLLEWSTIRVVIRLREETPACIVVLWIEHSVLVIWVIIDLPKKTSSKTIVLLSE